MTKKTIYAKIADRYEVGSPNFVTRSWCTLKVLNLVDSTLFITIVRFVVEK